MLVHQSVPACALIRTSKAHGHIAELKFVRGAWSMSDLTSMKPTYRYAKQKVRKSQNPREGVTSWKRRLAWKDPALAQVDLPQYARICSGYRIVLVERASRGWVPV